ncbi:MAG: glycosyltransferase family 1 protein [Candidatus Jettenia sp.]|uniref:Glycosyltransferase n=1 Tax=Candidatus Jettenia caeni TaxID=247490 RepID=I3INB1_9BACT|nr:glycosyltransferase family 4 protein [Candidatus Jettenia sp. AMX1]MBC6928087.1 glycosyltransferase family 1 protein [Candidatus Jettenia sp.]WKZ14886.1 MAG: glycosyltransferase family 4 protein [Candidatus Jettenia caeni]KAA0251188.1 MAG: glycosyltransferase family 1 protein [Candidatus Jettenia sp. AMX1]MCE7879272.1 glycosyltransferase family 1 protein [Candidatus Jettenia sp. AMX1]MCQ3927502.1 glycosyltransferase family 1 protein [Candidatus Jettenia sp.]
MNILQVNKFHYLRGGSERVYFGTADILEKHGHTVKFFSMSHPENIPCETSKYFMPDVDLNTNDGNPMSQLKIAFRILYSFEAKKRISRVLDQYPADIAHLHNIHHQISPSILHELRSRKIPIVMTLHDYKMVCGSYSLIADEKICEDCNRGRYFSAIRKRCIKDSRTKSVLAAVEMYLHHTLLDIYGAVDVFISPSLFLKNKLQKMGFKKPIIHLPNFVMNFEDVRSEPEDNGSRKEKSLVYFGRLSPEKGLSTLMKAVKILQAKDGIRIKVKIIGEGPLKDVLEKNAEELNHVQFFGYMRGQSLYHEIKKSTVVVLPSEWYENNPISVLEAFALGKPVIGARIGGIPELVKNNVTGLTFESGNVDDLVEKITAMLESSDRIIHMGENARLFVERELNAEKYYQELMKIYQSVIRKNR